MTGVATEDEKKKYGWSGKKPSAGDVRLAGCNYRSMMIVKRLSRALIQCNLSMGLFCFMNNHRWFQIVISFFHLSASCFFHHYFGK